MSYGALRQPEKLLPENVCGSRAVVYPYELCDRRFETTAILLQRIHIGINTPENLKSRHARAVRTLPNRD